MNLAKFKKINNVPAFRKMTHWVFNTYYRDNKSYKIQNGPLKGKKWFFRRGTSLWIPLGNYENETAAWLLNHIKEDSTFLDVGANLGYFSLLASFQISTGQIVAFEPVDKNLATLNKNMEINNVSNVEVIPKALSNKEGKARFAVEANGANSHFEDINLIHANMNKEDVVEVDVTTLDIFCQKRKMVPNVIKVDVEGAEVDVLRGATELLKSKSASWLVSIHTDILQEQTVQIFKDYGYSTKLLHGLECEVIAIPN